MSLVTNDGYEYKVNFWANNQELLAVKKIRDLYEKDNSQEKLHSSQIMWAVYFITDYHSKYVHLPMDTRKKLIEDDFLEHSNFFIKFESVINPIVAIYKELQKDSERRYLDTWMEVAEKRRHFIDATEYTKGTWEMLDKMLINSKQILAQKDEIMERINRNEGNIMKLKGDIKLSLLAQGELISTSTYTEVHGNAQEQEAYTGRGTGSKTKTRKTGSKSKSESQV